MVLKFNQINEVSEDLVTTILTNRGIEDITQFLNPSNASDLNVFEVANIVRGIQTLCAHMSVYSKMAIVVDADADGFLSASIIYQYLKSIDENFNIDFIIHEKKTHGLTDAVMEKLAEKPYELIIIPDAGSNDGRQIEVLYAMGAEVLIIDHHIIEEMPSCGIIVNNQIGDAANKHLTGAGLTLRFCQAIDHVLKINKAEKYIDLAAVGQVADASDISDPEVRNMVFEGIKRLENDFLKEALKKKDMIMPVPKDLSFSVIPLINAIVRVGTLEEKVILFRALNNITPEIFVVDKKKKNKETGKFDKFQVEMNLQQYAAEVATKCKTRQDGAVKKAVAAAEDNIRNEGGVAIIITDVEEKFASLTGLIATKMVNKLQKPVILLRNAEGTLNGSGRGYEPTMSNLKDWCQETKAVNYAQGHEQAFGIEIESDNLDIFKKHADSIEATDFSYDVDYVFNEEVGTGMVWEVDKNKHIFGGRVTDPLFAYTNIDVPKKDITAKGTVLTFFKNGLEFVMYGTTPEYQEQFTAGFAASHKLDFIGRPGINDWLGKEKPQIVLEAVDFSPEEQIDEENIIF